VLLASFTGDAPSSSNTSITTNSTVLVNSLVTSAVEVANRSLTLSNKPLAVINLPVGQTSAATGSNAGQLQMEIEGVSVTPGLPPGSVAPSDTFLVHAAYSSSSQSISGVQLTPPVFQPAWFSNMCTHRQPDNRHIWDGDVLMHGRWHWHCQRDCGWSDMEKACQMPNKS
jgi:hypothetical protein